jgi:hypothetical protein
MTTQLGTLWLSFAFCLFIAKNVCRIVFINFYFTLFITLACIVIHVYHAYIYAWLFAWQWSICQTDITQGLYLHAAYKPHIDLSRMIIKHAKDLLRLDNKTTSIHLMARTCSLGWSLRNFTKISLTCKHPYYRAFGWHNDHYSWDNNCWVWTWVWILANDRTLDWMSVRYRYSKLDS